ncbi:helix-turn-helix transcriptional regulator [Amycolatopsis sp. NPDC006131]|uniref:helix-turn-helix transcriptional regulator n=1 Tax=Amycolatopsis sp. NPDC006131 TaxID=3156731 RepID=UPI0033B70A36
MQIEAILPAMATNAAADSVEADLVRERAVTAMRVLRELIPWEGYALSAWDAVSGTHRHVTLASEGYSAQVQAHMNDAFVQENPGFQLLHTRVPDALRWSDLARDWQVEFSKTFSAEVVLIPAGFKEGATMCLRLPNGRYTGALHVSWARPHDASDEARRTIEGFRPLLAQACDLLSALPAEHHVGPDAHAVVVSSTGTVSQMPGRSAGPVLLEHIPNRVLRDLAMRGSVRRRYLWAGPKGSCHRIDVIPCRGQATLISEEQIPWPFDLSPREAQILHLVAQGFSNPRIARELFISPRTVSTHVEHLLEKLACESRARLAAIAVGADLVLLNATDA